MRMGQGDDVKRKPGRPPFAPTKAQRAMVEAMASYGIPQKEIAGVVGVAYDTLRKHFAVELVLGSAKATAKVAEFLYQKATGKKGDDHAAVVAAIFWLKARAGWKDRQDVVVQNPDGSSLFEDWPSEKLLPVMERAVEVLRFQAKKGDAGKKAAG